MATFNTTRLLVWWMGAVGGAVAAYLVRSGHTRDCIDVDVCNRCAINQVGIRVVSPVDSVTAQPATACPQDLRGTFDLILLYVKAVRTADAAGEPHPHLAGDGCVVSLQNGLNKLTLVGLLGRAAVRRELCRHPLKEVPR